MKRARITNSQTEYAIFNDLKLPGVNPLADYDTKWDAKFNDRKLITATQCQESSVLFAAREGWVTSTAPSCNKSECSQKNNLSYCTLRSDTLKQ